MPICWLRVSAVIARHPAVELQVYLRDVERGQSKTRPCGNRKDDSNGGNTLVRGIMHRIWLVFVAVVLCDNSDFCHLRGSDLNLERETETVSKNVPVWWQLTSLHLLPQTSAIQTAHFLPLGLFKVVLSNLRNICINKFDDELARRDCLIPERAVGYRTQDLIN